MTPSREMNRPDLMNPMVCSLWWFLAPLTWCLHPLCRTRAPDFDRSLQLSLTALSGAQLVGDADGVTYGLRLSEHGQYQVGYVWPRDEQAVAYVAVYRSPVRAGERSLGEPRWPDGGPVQAPVPQQVFHGGEVGIDGAKESSDERAEDGAHQQVVAGVIARRMRLVGRRHNAHRRGTDHHEAADARTVHGVRDGGGRGCNDPGLGCPVRADSGDHCVDVAWRGGEDFGVRSGQVLPYDVDVRRQL